MSRNRVGQKRNDSQRNQSALHDPDLAPLPGPLSASSALLDSLKEGALVDVVFSLDLVPRARGGGSHSGIWLKVLAIEPSAPGNPV